ncbi:MAG TPA: DUF4124 domain-containing protein [Pseudoxanthomonas sp.]|nr:DUF4124 domain-containing protein [Pseudoxanthomonas sp.]
MRSMLLALGLLPAAPAFAADVVFYRCTDAAGHLTIQNSPCPKGMREEKKAMQGISTVPMGKPTKPAAPAPMPSKPQIVPDTPQERPAEIVDDGKPRLPPPVLFQCTTYDRDSYITESGEPQKRCVPLRTVGLDGNPSTGAGQACDIVYDQCARVPDGALCDAWKKRLGETEVAWRFGRAENLQKNQAEFERVRRIVDESTCGAASP